MAEWKRIVTHRRLLAVLLAIVLINGFLFLQEQKDSCYGLDCSLPATTVLTENTDQTNGFSLTEMDTYAIYRNYLQRIEQAKDTPISLLIEELEREKSQLEEILTVYALLNNANAPFSGDGLESYRVRNPELVQKLENQAINISDVTAQYIAANNVLQQALYINAYPSFLESIQKSKEDMLSFSIFGNGDTFSQRNILKTASDFECLEDIELKIGAGGAVTALMNFRITDYFLLFLSFLVVAYFLEERKSGLWRLIHATPNGRFQLAAQRIFLLLAESVLCVLVLYGENLIIGFCIYGGAGNLENAVQSIESLGKLPTVITTGQFLVHYMIQRIVTIFLISLLLWLFFSGIPNVKFAFVVFAGILCLSYILYSTLPVQSYLNLLKYFNLFTYIHLADLYISYLNINLFGFPVGIRILSEYAAIPLCVALSILCIGNHSLQKPGNQKNWPDKIAVKCNCWIDQCIFHLRMLGLEMWKTLWLQKGILVIPLLLYIAGNLSFSANIPVSNPVQSAEKQYTIEFEGEITPQTFTQIQQVQAQLNEAITAYEEAKTAYQKGNLDSSTLNIYAHKANEAQVRLEAMDNLLQRAEMLQTKAKQTNFVPWLIDCTPYESVYGDVASSNQQASSVLILFTLALLLSGSISFEFQSHMHPLLLSCARGRNALLARKIAVAGISSVAVGAVIFGFELSALLTSLNWETLSASVQNLCFMENSNISCSIRTFLLILYLVRLLILLCCGILILAISSLAGRHITIAYSATLAILVLPSALYFYLKVELVKFVSLAYLLQLIPLLKDKYAVQWLILLCMALGGIMGASLSFLKKCMRIRSSHRIAASRISWNITAT